MSDGLDRNGFTPEEMAVVRNIFATSSAEYLSAFNESLSSIKALQYDDTVFEPLHRSVHSLKGAAMQLGFLPVGNLALAMETVIKKIRVCDVATVDFGEAIALFEAGERKLQEYVCLIKDDEELEETATELISQLEAFGEQVDSCGGH